MASVTTAAIPIAVQSSITDAENPSQFRDIKNVVFLDEPATASSMPWGMIATIGGLAIAGVVGLLGVSRFWKRLSPKQRALKELDQLSASDLVLKQDSKLVYENATQILREFIESQFDFPATRQTTEEFLVAVNADRRLGEQLQQRLKQFLQSADMVKFAGLSCSPNLLKSAIDNARQFVVQADEQRIAAAKFVAPPSGGIPAKASATNFSEQTTNTNKFHNSSSMQKETV